MLREDDVDIVIGRIVRAHGIRGEVSVDVRTDEVERRFAVGTEVTTDPTAAGPLTVLSTRPHGDNLLVRFAKVHSRTAAEGLRGVLLTAVAEEADTDDDSDTFYAHHLVGLRVVTTDGTEVGEVAEVLTSPAHDLLCVRRDDGREALVPFVSELVPDVDLASGRLRVADRPGLLDPDAADGEQG
jgi:16S rRNA processing protein RimM